MAQDSEEYKGHRIELRVPETDELSMREAEPEAEREVKHKSNHKIQPELLIDDTPFEYGQLPDGKYFLQEYAYDWRDDLLDLAKGFIDYKIKTDESRRKDSEKHASSDELKEEK